jgi:hypothetical protein
MFSLTLSLPREQPPGKVVFVHPEGGAIANQAIMELCSAAAWSMGSWVVLVFLWCVQLKENLC